MFLSKGKFYNKVIWCVFSFSSLLLFGCGAKYGVNRFHAIDINRVGMEGNMERFKIEYAKILTPPYENNEAAANYWDNAELKGFLCDRNHRYLENGLGYIFFNTLRAKLRKSVNHTDLRLWENKYPGFQCPNPWRYEIRRINGFDYGVFYLPSVQMGEYFYDNDMIPFRNIDKIHNRDEHGRNKGYALSPYMKVYYNDNNRQEDSRDFVLNIDHLLKDNNYLIELPSKLHDLKTDYLDPFILFPTQTRRVGERSVNVTTYWRNSPDYLNANALNIDMCRCQNQFHGPQDGLFPAHIHNEEWKQNWAARMKRDNVVLQRR